MALKTAHLYEDDSWKTLCGAEALFGKAMAGDEVKMCQECFRIGIRRTGNTVPEERKPLYVVKGYADGEARSYTDKEAALAEGDRLTKLPPPKVGVRSVTVTEERLIFAWNPVYNG